ncbi:outer membrane beta-barrel family protein [Tenacibaculum finnmarkense]|uniref:outer membrane beta-barrel family protein n=1 Tax=Tenacibaculum finnmarkense TaxID=2781243 RepID=UPI001EFAD388|nr:outer membrane beta-barrel family protein [Tenacibaculum finnmarkense]MCG8208168.1 hypothetical protein [Tenacibaculum finnmarkense genomovar finnmarkense]MCG8724158.1 hypothetical protein [Tenacibaculum finnmarkense]MCG8765879.1 hypothetical protein [Tenacibaculum finnmarkense]MCG8778817.1 hypothetical protein [Tenacibaculum finnmarkense]MCM8907287.1 hypothetical protein [Tenacibaculum finnmarkense genomovar finnmarkense]
MKIKILLLIGFLPLIAFAQNLDKIGKSDLFKLTGGVAANMVYYNGNSNRDPFTYILSGSINVNISDVYNIPFSFSYSNAKFQKNNPFSFNRLSMHPSYKWATAHLGDVSMTFSPYTLSGHQFTGIGFDLSPGDKFKVSVMYGTLLKEREYEQENFNGVANYKRNGYGIKASYKYEKGTVGVIFFKAKDNENSLQNEIPIEKDIQPKENVVISIDGNHKVTNELSIKAEIAVSALTEDVRVAKENNDFSVFLLNTNVSTQYYKAYNLHLNYQFGKGVIGLGYERIDPNYKTLGGYYFNNDLENITVNASQRIFKDKLGITVNAGLQKDDLDDTKISQLRRLVFAINTNYSASEKLNVTAGYSSFQSFTNIKNQFDYINEISQVENELDKANISQISKSASLNVNYTLKKTKQKRENINIGFTYQNAVNEIDDKVREEDVSSFYNGNAVYTIAYPEDNLTISGALNGSYSKIAQNKGIIIGPTVSANKSYLDKKLKITSAVSYNKSINNGESQGEIINLRLGGRYVYKKRHNFSLTALNQFRKSISKSRKDLTITFGYNYALGSFSSKDIRFKKRIKKEKTKKEYLIKFKYKDSIYEGTISVIDTKLLKLIESPLFKDIPSYKKEKLNTFREKISKEENKKAYKIKAIQYLKDLYDVKKYRKTYNELLFSVIKDLSKNINSLALDYAIETDYVKVNKEIIKHELWNKTSKDIATYSKKTQNKYIFLVKEEKAALLKLLTHRWIKATITNYKTFNDITSRDTYLEAFFKQEGGNIYKMIDNKVDINKIKIFLLKKVIVFYAKESKKAINFEEYELKYVYKN